MPTLLVMRHAKSSWSTNDPDRLRPLNERGVRDATAAGAVLAEYPIDLLLSSSATRTRQTWARAESAGAQADQVVFSDDLYGAWTESVVEMLRELDPSVQTAMVLGHEPTMSSLVFWLAQPSDLVDTATEHYATSALSVLTFAAPWPGLTQHAAELVRFEVPRG